MAGTRPAAPTAERIALTDQSALAIEGGAPVRTEFLPYGRHDVDGADVDAVVRALQSDWLTTGPLVAEFERAFGAAVGARHAVAVSSGTAALHTAMFALGIGPGDEVVVPTMTFAATANCVLFQGARPVFADVDRDTLLIDARQVETLVTARTRAIIAVDYAGQPCDYDALRDIARRHRLHVVADAAHSLGARYHGRSAATFADLATFSLHPVKHITTGEGGIVVTDDGGFADRMRRFRNHGITVDHRQRRHRASWIYEIGELGYNYRITDVQCALGASQLPKLESFIERRRAIARYYDEALASMPALSPLTQLEHRSSAYHLYVVRLDRRRFRVAREEIFQALHAEGIGVNVHYLPLHLQPLYRERLGTREGQCPAAEAAYEEVLTLPLFPGMTDGDAADVIRALQKVTTHFAA